MSTIEITIICIYIAGVIFNISYLHWFGGKDRYEQSELDEDSGPFDSLFVGFFTFSFVCVEGIVKLLLCLGSWISTICYICWLVHFLYFTNEGKYRREYHKYLKQIVSTLTDWNRHLQFEKIEIRNSHINIYYKRGYKWSDKNKSYITRHIKKALDGYPTLIPNVEIYNVYCNNSKNHGYNYKTKLYLRYSKQEYENKNISYN